MEDLLILLWRGLKPAVLFILGLRLLPSWLRAPARRLAVLILASSALWGIFLLGLDMTWDGARYFKFGDFVRAHAWLIALAGLAALSFVLLGPPACWRCGGDHEDRRHTGDGDGRESGPATGATASRRRLPVRQERALRAAAAEVVARSVNSSGSWSNADPTGGNDGERRIRKSDGAGGGPAGAAAAAAAAAVGDSSALASVVASPIQQQHLQSGLATPQGSQRFLSASSSLASTPRRRSPRLVVNAHPHRRQRPQSPGLAPVAEGEEE
jgi:hypothetical protein